MVAKVSQAMLWAYPKKSNDSLWATDRRPTVLVALFGLD
jgi:hypothetical protein